MAKKQDPIFKCPNDLKINVTKSNGEVVIDEECCTSVSVILKNSGEMATSFFGAYNSDVIKILEKAIKVYFKGVKKTLKNESMPSAEEEIKVVDKDIPDKNKWNGQPVPDKKDDNESKTKADEKTSNKPKGSSKRSVGQKTTSNTSKNTIPKSKSKK